MTMIFHTDFSFPILPGIVISPVFFIFSIPTGVLFPLGEKCARWFSFFKETNDERTRIYSGQSGGALA